jgi:hypothetical protein
MKKIEFLFLFVFALLSVTTNGQVPFTKGNIVLVRLGNGSTSYAGVSAPVFLDEITPAGALVQSIALPTADNGANFKITANFNRGAFSFLTRSSDKQYLAFVGFNADPGVVVVNLAQSTRARTIARIDYNGTINTSTSMPGSDFATGSSPLCSITDDGSRFWTTHDGATGGIRYSAIGATSTSNILTSSSVSTVNVDNNQLYCTAGRKPSIVSGGLPTAGPQTATAFPGIPAGVGSSIQFFMADINPGIPGNDVLYLTDSDGGLYKYSLVGSTWVSNGIIGDFDLYRGITGVVNGSTVTLYSTRMIDDNVSSGGGELVKIIDNTGYNPGPNTFNPTPTILRTAVALTAFRGVALAPEAVSVSLSTKVFLQGAYNGSGRHKDVTPTWASTLNANALNQPFSGAPFNYAGTESVTNGFFTSTAATTDITDWVLLELHDATTPSTIVARQAAFVREDGKVVGLDGTSDPTFIGVAANNYYIVIRHRNHLPIRSASTVLVSGGTPVLYDFTTGQAQAYQDPAILTNSAMKDLGLGVFGMFAGNANGNNNIRFTGLNNDAGVILTALSGNQGGTATGYNMADLNLDGTVRFTGLNNDAGVLLTALNGNQSNLFTQHQ